MLPSRFETATLRRRPLVVVVALGVVLAASACSTTDTSDLAPGPQPGAAGNGGAAGNRGGSGGAAGKAGAGAGAGGTTSGGAGGGVTGGSGGAVSAGAGGTFTAGSGGTLGAGFGGAITGGAAGAATGGTSSGGSNAGGAGGAGQGGGAAGQGGGGGTVTAGAGGQGANGGSPGGGAAGEAGSSGQGGGGAAGQGGSGGGATGQTVLVRTQHYDGSPSAGVRVRLNEEEKLSGANGEVSFSGVSIPYTIYHDAGPESQSLIQRVIIRGFVDMTDLAPVVRVSQTPNFSQRPQVTFVVKAKTAGNTPLAVGQSVCLVARETFSQQQCANVIAGGDATFTVSLDKQNQPAIVLARSAVNGGGDLIGATRIELSGMNGDTVARDVNLETFTEGTFKPSADVPAGYTAQAASLIAEPNDGLPYVLISVAATDGTLAQLSKRTLPWLDLKMQVRIQATADASSSATFTRSAVDDLLGAKATFLTGEPIFSLPAGAAKLGIGGVITLGAGYADRIVVVRSQGAGQNIQDDPRHRWLIVRTQRSSFTLPPLESFHGKWQAGDPGSVSVTGLPPGTPVSLTNVQRPEADGVKWTVQRTITLE